MARPNLRQLEVFSALMSTRSASETAKRLHVTQPAVSKTIAALEEVVGLQLFERVGGRIVPTADAERLRVQVDRVFEQMNSLAGSIAGLRSGRSGSLSVTTVPAMAASLIGMCAGRFQKERDEVRVVLMAKSSAAAVEDVERGHAELAFIHGPPTSTDVKGVILGESEFVCAMRADHPLAGMTHLRPRDLYRERLIFLDESTPPSHAIRTKFAETDLTPHVVMDTNMSFAARAAVQEGSGIAVIDSLFAMLDTRGLKLVPFRPRVPLQIYCAHSAHRTLSPLAEQFIETVRTQIRKDKSPAKMIAWR